MRTVHFAIDDAVVRVEDGDARVLADGAFGVECLATTDESLLVGTVGDGLLRRPHGGDGGAAAESDGGFETVEGIAEARVTSLAVGFDGACWAGTEPSSVYRSTDAGRTWTELPGLTDLPSAEEWSFPPRPHTHHVRWLEPAPADPDRLYVGVEAGAFVLATGVTDPAGVEWRDRPPGSRRDNHTLATHPDAPDRVYSAAGDGYAESADGGETWTELVDGLDHRYCWSVAVDPGDPDTRVLSAASGAYRAHRAGSAESYCYRRTGDGPWERVSGGLPTGEGVLRAVLDSGDAGEFYAVNSEGLYRSADAGATWEAVGLGDAWLDRFADEPPRGLVVG
jgi:photosystem II stability/assembly factor-like uncharacterized protein